MRRIRQIVPPVMAACLLYFPADTSAGEKSAKFQITVDAGSHDREATPVHVVVPVPAGLAKSARVKLTDSAGKAVPAQLAGPAFLDKPEPAPKGTTLLALWWILPNLTSGKSTRFQATIAAGDRASSTGFAWRDSPSKHMDLLFGDRPVLRYMYQAYKNDPAKRDLNNKPFHHMFDPKGTRLVTKGSGGHYTHHQGLFYGFTRCTFEGGKCNTWYCHDGEYELHKEFLNQIAGPVLARHRARIDWNGQKGKPFCSEVRELTVFALNGGTLVEWSSRLSSVRGTVTLDGDPQHAGFQFRADNEVAVRQKEKLTYYLRPDGKGKPGETRNEVRGKPDAPATKQVTNLPWNVMSFVLGKQRYSAVYIDSPSNPKPAVYSERAYGRFGSWFGKQTLKEGGPPIEITYRIWLQEAEMTADQAASLSADFADPPKTKVARIR